MLSRFHLIPERYGRTCCIMVMFFTISSHRLRSFYTILRTLYTYLSKMTSAIFLWQVT